VIFLNFFFLSIVHGRCGDIVFGEKIMFRTRLAHYIIMVCHDIIKCYNHGVYNNPLIVVSYYGGYLYTRDDDAVLLFLLLYCATVVVCIVDEPAHHHDRQKEKNKIKLAEVNTKISQSNIRCDVVSHLETTDTFTTIYNNWHRP